jgi:hypothetical protein
VQALDGKPIAVLANYSMHYVGVSAKVVSADYFGHFCRKLRELAGGGIAIMSQGTSGDLHWMDYGQPRKPVDISAFATELAQVAAGAMNSIAYRDDVTIDAKQATLALSRRLPDRERLEWATKIRTASNFQVPKTQQEVYAREQLYLAATPSRELVLQALRIGDLGIAAIPNEVYAITGLKLKAHSPLKHTMNIELANGAEGYIPPPKQHKLGGYTTWPARTAGLEVQAEPKIVERLLTLLEQVAGSPRRKPQTPFGAYARAALDAKPAAHWPLDEFQGTSAADASGNGHHATYGDGVALYLDGVDHRAVHLAGGHIEASVPLPQEYSVEFWFYANVAGEATLFSRGADRLAFGGNRVAFGSARSAAEISLNRWMHVALVRGQKSAQVYLNGESAISTAAPASPQEAGLTFGAGFEGKLDEISVWDRLLTSGEIRRRVSLPGQENR